MKILCLLFVVVTMLACEARMPETYVGKQSAYIIGDSYLRTMEHTFFFVTGSNSRDTVWITVQTMGKTSPERRSFRLMQVNVESDSAAIGGEHYVPFDSEEISPYLFVEGNSAQVQVPVILLKTEEMDLKKFKLVIAIQENEYFEAVDLPEYADYTIITTALAEKPSRWDSDWKRDFGEWGSVKMKFIMEITGYVDWDKPLNDVQYRQYMLTKCKEALYEYNLTYPEKPLAEADGTSVTFS